MTDLDRAALIIELEVLEAMEAKHPRGRARVQAAHWIRDAQDYLDRGTWLNARICLEAARASLEGTYPEHWRDRPD